MRLPAASILVDGQTIASCGARTTAQQSVPLRQGSQTVGELRVGLRAGQSRLDVADIRLLGLLSAPLAVAVRATALTEDLHQAREAVVVAREEERRRLRRDLHDGLGPALTGVGLKAHAARRVGLTDPSRSVTLLTDLGAEVTAAINDVRRLVNGLRPPALDGLGGLVAALRDQAAILCHHPDGTSLTVSVDAEALPPVLPAATEAAVYRIATEALTNVSRHSTASTARVSLVADARALTLLIADNGTDASDWRAGVGLTSMHERASELGGACEAGPSPHGGRVSVSIPLRGSP
jgi:signal transduction histidine kinase